MYCYKAGTESAKFWPIFLQNALLDVLFKGLNNAVAWQKWQISGMPSIDFSLEWYSIWMVSSYEKNSLKHFSALIPPRMVKSAGSSNMSSSTIPTCFTWIIKLYWHFSWHELYMYNCTLYNAVRLTRFLRPCVSDIAHLMRRRAWLPLAPWVHLWLSKKYWQTELYCNCIKLKCVSAWSA